MEMINKGEAESAAHSVETFISSGSPFSLTVSLGRLVVIRPDKEEFTRRIEKESKDFLMPVLRELVESLTSPDSKLNGGQKWKVSNRLSTILSLLFENTHGIAGEILLCITRSLMDYIKSSKADDNIPFLLNVLHKFVEYTTAEDWKRIRSDFFKWIEGAKDVALNQPDCRTQVSSGSTERTKTSLSWTSIHSLPG